MAFYCYCYFIPSITICISILYSIEYVLFSFSSFPFGYFFFLVFIFNSRGVLFWVVFVLGGKCLSAWLAGCMCVRTCSVWCGVFAFNGSHFCFMLNIQFRCYCCLFIVLFSVSMCLAVLPHGDILSLNEGELVGKSLKYKFISEKQI